MRDIEESNDWSEYRRLVTQTLKDLDQDIKDLTKKVDDMRLQMSLDIARLQTKAGMWGGIVGFIGSIIVTVIAEAVLRK